MSLRQEHQTLMLESDYKHKSVMQILLKNNNKETTKGKSFQTEFNCSLSQGFQCLGCTSIASRAICKPIMMLGTRKLI
jgi:hypothetical protein